MAIQAPRGTRDFYPAEMARLNRIFDAWRRVSLRAGFEEIEGPAFETLELYTAKSGQEIVNELFTVSGRGESGEGDARYALRPELTPSLARMINQRARSLRMPVKWFSIPRMWRGERPQKGRLREFFQWNIDVVGAEERVADAEVIGVAVDVLRELGLGPADVVVKISSRPLLASLLADLGIPDGDLETLYGVIDKRRKVDLEKFRAMLAEKLPGNDALVASIFEMTGCTDLDALPSQGERSEAEKADLLGLFRLLGEMGLSDWCGFDLGVVRGLAYYTGPVFEVFDRAATMRAVAGGGRYDNLLEVLGGPKIPAVGFGMGDVVLADLLQEKGLLADATVGVDYFLIDADEKLFGRLLKLARELRARGVSATYSYRRSSVSKQFKQAAAANARRVIVLGDELAQGRVAVKDLAAGVQATIPLSSLLDNPSQPVTQ
ncbi:MAG: Histidine--tRNA ligase [Phycisphaerae bacterium]|nr:Histidine--tRNA ligase [Phycisphaerae bacterium]